MERKTGNYRILPSVTSLSLPTFRRLGGTSLAFVPRGRTVRDALYLWCLKLPSWQHKMAT